MFGPRSRAIIIRWSLCGFILLTYFLRFDGLAKGATSLQTHFRNALAAYTVSGTVFDDYNQNGAQDTREPGINGIIVTAYNSAGTSVGTATTATSGSTLGQYTLSIPNGTGPVRIQFSNYGATSSSTQLVGYQPSNHAGGTPVSFVDGTLATNTVKLGLEHPEEYCQNNPNVVTSCYVLGNQTTATDHVMVSFPYNSRGNTTAPTPMATAPQLGSTWGLAYRRYSDSLFASAFMKRHSGFKPSGSTGAIYLINNASTASPTVNASPFVDLNSLFGAATAGADPHNTANYPVDTPGYDPVGKISLGGLAISADQATLYTMNLSDQKLYSIPIGLPPAAPTAPSAASITRTAVPLPADCVANDFRPFAVTFYREQVYVGAVCSAESTVTGALPLGNPAAMHAYVFVYTPGTGFTTAPVFETGLNYTRHCAMMASTAGCNNIGTAFMTTSFPAAWNPWHNTFIGYKQSSQGSIVYPQPMLASLAFDNGDLILGLRDRFGDQTGYNLMDDPSHPATSEGGDAAGDTLRACLNTAGNLASGWALESNGACGSRQTAGNNNGKGPGIGVFETTTGNGQYYYEDFYIPYHDHVASGGVLQIPGFAGVMVNVFDPIPGGGVNIGGVRTYDDTNGTGASSGYAIYTTTSGTNTFGKSNGLGALVAICQSAPIEIGNRVWKDTNGNGLQDANEAGIAGVTVHLYAANGTTLQQTTTTDANGNYYFTISSYTGYVVKLDNTTDYSTGVLKGYRLSTANQDPAHLIDSNATLPTPASPIGTSNYPQMTITSHTPGQNDAGFDVGLIPPPDIATTKSVALSLGNLALLSAIPTASSSLESGGWSISKVNDGQTTSTGTSLGWSSNLTTAINHTEWVQLNFGTARTFQDVELYPRTDAGNVGYGFPIDFTIAVSNDGSTWTTVVTKTGYAMPTTRQMFFFPSQTAQYMRVTGTVLRSNPNDANYYRMQFAEIAVY